MLSISNQYYTVTTALCSEHVLFGVGATTSRKGQTQTESVLGFFFFTGFQHHLISCSTYSPLPACTWSRHIYIALEIYIWSRVCVYYQLTITATWVGLDSCRKRQFGDSARAVPAEVFTKYSLHFYAVHLCKVFVRYCREQRRGRAD